MAAGAKLLELDDTEVRVRATEAEANWLKAEQTLRELREWTSSPEYGRAARAVAARETENGSLKAKVESSRLLYSRGIIARQEFDDAKRQLAIQTDGLTAARAELGGIGKRATGDARKVAQMEAENASIRLAAARADVGRTVVVAPISGVALRPPSPQQDGNVNSFVGVGSRITKGQVLLSIADFSAIAVTANISEVDVGSLTLNQTVVVTFDALPHVQMSGHLTQVAVQASAANNGSTGASYGIRAFFGGVAQQEATSIRYGMSAHLHIVTYRNSDAVVLPITAIHERKGQKFADRFDWIAKSCTDVAVSTGYANEDSVEVKSGISAGEYFCSD